MSLTVVVALGLVCSIADAQTISQQVRISSSPNPVGSGARAVGMGSAFIAVADDATAASWNPGGLIQLERPEISLVGAYTRHKEDYTSDSHPEASGANRFDTTDLNYASVVYPFNWLNRNMVVSLNFQRLYDFNKELQFDFNQQGRIDAGAQFFLDQTIRFQQDGGLKTISPAYCIQLTPSFSLGATLNLWTDQFFSNGWQESYRAQGQGALIVGDTPIPFRTTTRIEDTYDRLRGINFHFGFLWNITPSLTLGGIVKTPFTAKFRHQKKISIQQEFTDGSQPLTTEPQIIEEDVELDFPLSYGLGVAWRVSDAFTCALDVYRTEWNRFVYRNGQGQELSPIDGRPASQSDIRPTHQVRLGAEYLFIRERIVIPARAGIFYDPQPAEGSTEDYFGFSLGSGIIYKSVAIDAAYEFRFGRDVNGAVIGIPSTRADVYQHKFLLSAIYYF